MDYLINEGYPGAAKHFAVEAGVQPLMGAENIDQRVSIRNSIHAGHIQSAIEQLNELDFEVRTSPPSEHVLL